MKPRRSLVLLGLALLPMTAAAQAPHATPRVAWKRMVLDTKFRSEGVAVADVNRDGRKDVLVGDCWYENLGGGQWKRHVLRKDRAFDPANYSESFGCFAGDFNGDGFPDLIVIPFPGAPCHWYENPGKSDGPWKQHLLATSACNETPIYVELFKTGRKVLVMGWNPPGSDNMGEMCYFTPATDPMRPWTKVSISGPSAKGKMQPGTQRFSHGLGHGDVNGDGLADVIVPQGWWEQPAKRDPQTPWTFHPADLGPSCADMYATDLNGDGKNDVVSSSAHDRGFWWYEQRAAQKGDPAFVRHDLFPTAEQLAKAPAGYTFTEDEQAVYDAINRQRDGVQRKSPLPAHAELCRMARDHAERLAKSGAKEANIASFLPDGKILAVATASGDLAPDTLAKALLDRADAAHLLPGYEIGISVGKSERTGQVTTLIVADRGRFALPAQTHALNYVDIDGDGLKDFVTGRRYWAHGAKGDRDPADPPVLVWFQAKRAGDGTVTFVPHPIDDDSGIGTQFAVEDLDGDGLPDVIVANKHGVYVFLQERQPTVPGKE